MTAPDSTPEGRAAQHLLTAFNVQRGPACPGRVADVIARAQYLDDDYRDRLGDWLLSVADSLLDPTLTYAEAIDK